MFVHAIRPVLNFSHLLRLEWTVIIIIIQILPKMPFISPLQLLDLFCAYFLAKFVDEYIKIRCANLANQKEELEKTKWLSTLAFARLILLSFFPSYPFIQLFIESNEHWMLDYFQFVGHC
jgi:hypothetical protein